MSPTSKKASAHTPQAQSTTKKNTLLPTNYAGFPWVWAASYIFFTILALAPGCNYSTKSFTDAANSSPKPPQTHTTFAGKYPIKIVCSTGMVADVVRNVGAERVSVTQLMGEGIDPHLYKASPSDVSVLNAADMVFYSGLHLEGKLGEVLEHMKKSKPTFAITEQIAEEKLLSADEGAHDPHVWFDVALWQQTVPVVSAALSEFDPPHADEYLARATAYTAELAALHDEAKQTLATVPESQRVLITAHDAFRYFGRAYDVEVRGIQGISTDSEAGVREINQLVDYIVANKIKAVFVESSVSDRNVQALIEGCAAQGHQVNIGGELFSDAMGKPGTPDGTYLGMMRHNVNTIAKALK